MVIPVPAESRWNHHHITGHPPEANNPGEPTNILTRRAVDSGATSLYEPPAMGTPGGKKVYASFGALWRRFQEEIGKNPPPPLTDAKQPNIDVHVTVKTGAAEKLFGQFFHFFQSTVGVRFSARVTGVTNGPQPAVTMESGAIRFDPGQLSGWGAEYFFFCQDDEAFPVGVDLRDFPTTAQLSAWCAETPERRDACAKNARETYYRSDPPDLQVTSQGKTVACDPLQQFIIKDIVVTPNHTAGKPPHIWAKWALNGPLLFKAFNGIPVDISQWFFKALKIKVDAGNARAKEYFSRIMAANAANNVAPTMQLLTELLDGTAP